MDKEGIESVKLNNSCVDVLEKYGIQVRNGRCKAICHMGTRYTAKVSHDLYYCFKCDQAMDVFDLTMNFTGCDFQEAYELLGGAEKISFKDRVKVKQRQAARKIIIQRNEKLDRDHKVNLMYITAYRNIVAQEEPMSDLWCFAVNKLTYQIGLLEEYMKTKGDERHGRDQQTD